MGSISKVFQSNSKHKEKVALIVELAKTNEKIVDELIDILRTGTEVERGTSAEVLKFVSRDKPSTVIKYIDTLIEYIDYKAPRVRWGVPESIGNLAKEYPYQVAKAIPKLLENTNDKSTVVRWCAAYALTEIAKYNRVAQKQLLSRFQEFINNEQNNGVRNVYKKAVSALS